MQDLTRLLKWLGRVDSRRPVCSQSTCKHRERGARAAADVERSIFSAQSRTIDEPSREGVGVACPTFPAMQPVVA